MLASWYAGVYSSVIKSENLSNLISQSLTCQTKSVKNSDILVAFITDQGMASKLLSSLCSSETINRQYGEVTVQWSHNEQEIIQYVGKGIADLALVKENVMLAFAAETTYRYQTVAQYKDYSTYLISLKEKPELTKQYLWGKRLGLLDYPSSRSGHIVPKGMLNDLGISESSMEIIYVNSHEALRDLLAAGKVDIISSFWKDKDEQRFSANYRTPIKTKVSGSKWYLKMETQNTDLICEIQTILQTLAMQTQSDYYSQLQLNANDCNLSSFSHDAQTDEK
tara:strand:+ start:4755 stop:5594 length:840 start_codon:yes stop_codon:yes gene_type:complete